VKVQYYRISASGAMTKNASRWSLTELKVSKQGTDSYFLLACSTVHRSPDQKRLDARVSISHQKGMKNVDIALSALRSPEPAVVAVDRGASRHHQIRLSTARRSTPRLTNPTTFHGAGLDSRASDISNLLDGRATAAGSCRLPTPASPRCRAGRYREVDRHSGAAGACRLFGGGLRNQPGAPRGALGVVELPQI